MTRTQWFLAFTPCAFRNYTYYARISICSVEILPMSTDWTNFREVIGDFAPGEALRGLLLLTYNFDGAWFHEMLEPEIFDRVVEHCLIIRDGRAIQRELPSFSCIRADAGYSTRIFHPKLLLGVTERRAMLAIGSSNLTRVARVGGRLLG